MWSHIIIITGHQRQCPFYMVSSAVNVKSTIFLSLFWHTVTNNSCYYCISLLKSMLVEIFSSRANRWRPKLEMSAFITVPHASHFIIIFVRTKDLSMLKTSPLSSFYDETDLYKLNFKYQMFLPTLFPNYQFSALLDTYSYFHKKIPSRPIYKLLDLISYRTTHGNELMHNHQSMFITNGTMTR